MYNFTKVVLFRKIDEISAEDEIREAFKVFDSVSVPAKEHILSLDPILTGKVNFETIPEWRWVY